MSNDAASEGDADRERRITTGLEAIRADWRAYFAILIAAPDQAARLTWTCQRFRVDEEVAAIALDQLRIFVLPDDSSHPA